MSVNSMPKENKMGTMPVKKLIFNMALPLIISMLIQALYNIVDSIFVSRISEDALTAVSLVFPVQNLMIAFATGTGVGMNALLSRRLGEKNREAAEEVANVGLLLSICTAVVFALFGVFGSQLYFSMQKGVSPIIAEYGAQYLSIVCIGSIGIFVEITAERMLQGTGQTLITMFIQGIGAIINIILDPIMIFGLLGCPAMGVRGAAYATIIGQLVAAVLGIVLNQKHNTDVRVNLKKIRFNFPIIGEIYAIGLPSVIMIAIGSVMTFLMNKILITYHAAHETAATAFGAYFKLNSFIFMPVFGMNNGVVPIVAYNYGARNRKRMVETIKRGALYGQYDDGERYAYFCKAVMEMLRQIDWYPDILHAHDWQSALSVVYLKTRYASDPAYAGIRSVFTIHNIEYQGKYSFSILGLSLIHI